jgi:hypothetical protein
MSAVVRQPVNGRLTAMGPVTQGSTGLTVCVFLRLDFSLNIGLYENCYAQRFSAAEHPHVSNCIGFI